jgi:putative transposase
MSDSATDEALRRYRIIRPFLHDRTPLTVISRQSALPLRTLRRWASRFHCQGIKGLTRQPRADKGTLHSLPPAQKQLIEALALAKPRHSVMAICRTVCALPANGQHKCPGYTTVFRIVRAIDPALLSLAHEGSKVYSERYDLLYRRQAAAPNALWQADHTELDIMVLDEQGKPARPWLSVIIDDYSRAVAGYFLSLQAPSALQTSLALRQAIWRKAEPAWQVCGIPDVLYNDNGSDFTSQHLEQVCADLKIRMVFSLPGKPRGRGRIERFFRTVNQCCLSTLPGYAPGGLPGKISAPRIPQLTLTELDTALRRFFVEEYNRQPHSTTGIAPQERWRGNGFLPRMPESLEQLDLLLLTVVKPRKVQQDGIRFQGFRYIDPVLAAYVGETVTIRYDPRDLAEVRVFCREAFICRAVCQELAGETVSLREVIGARRKRARELRQILKERQHLLDFTFPTPHAQASSRQPAADRHSGEKTAQRPGRIPNFPCHVEAGMKDGFAMVFSKFQRPALK